MLGVARRDRGIAELTRRTVDRPALGGARGDQHARAVRQHDVGGGLSAELGGEIVRPEGERKHVRRERDRLAVREPARRLDQYDLRDVADLVAHPAAVGRVAGLRDDDRGRAARAGEHREILPPVRSVGRIDPHRDAPKVVVRVEKRAHLIARVGPAVGRDGVLEIEDRAARARAERLAETVRPVGRNEEEQGRIERHPQPC